MNKEKLYFFLRKELKDWGFHCQFDSSMIEPVIISQSKVAEWSRDLVRLIYFLREHFENSAGINNKITVLNTIGKAEKYNLARPIIARPDCVLTKEKELKVLEFNIDSSLGGLMQLSFFTKKYRKLYQKENIHYLSPLEGLVKVLNSVCINKFSIRVLILVSKRFTEYDIGYCKKFTKLLAQEANIRAKIAFIEDFFSDDKKVEKEVSNAFDVVYRFDVVKSDDPVDVNIMKFIKVCENLGVPVLSNTYDLNIEDKASLAELTGLKHHDHTPVDIKRLIEKYIPETVCAHDLLEEKLPSELNNVFSDIQKEKEKYVLKKIYSFGGKDVYVGKYESQDSWNKILKALMVNPGNWVIQIFQNSSLNLFEPGSFKHRELRNLVISPFIFHDQIEGFLTRYLCDRRHNGVTGLQRGSNMGFFMVGVKI